jgi:subfamily B ATP-binding cassette protein MsbA
MKDLKRLLKYLKPYWLIFVLATLAMVVVSILETATSALVVPIFDQVFSPEVSAKKTQTLFNLQNLIPDSGIAAWRTIALLLLIFTLLKGIADFFSSYLMAIIGQSSVLNLRRELYDHLLAQPASFFERHRTNFLVSRLVTSAAAIEQAVTSTLRDMLKEGTSLIAFISAAFYFNWRLTIGSLILAPIVGFLTAKFSTALRNLSHESFEGSKVLTDTAQETLTYREIVKAYQAENRERERFYQVAMKILRAQRRSAKLSALSPPIMELVGILFVAVLLLFAQNEIASERMVTSQFVAFLVCLFSGYQPMRRLSRLHNQMEQALAAARHVWEVMDENDVLPQNPNAVQLSSLKDKIEFRNVHFDYADEDKPVLNNLSLEIPSGSMVALVGESGGGKSTLTKLIPRFYDVREGAILWDGVDLRDADLKSLRRNIAVVTQETILFNDTVRYNITYGKPDATEKEMIEAARVAFAHDFIKELPNGYNTIVGERGTFLSGGQRQRLAIARAVLVDAPVLILDEATSALDTESERLVQQALANLIQNRTTIVIAHRLSTVRKANKIVVIERGQIVETGTHNELIAKEGKYKQLYELQFAEEEEIAANSKQ